MNCRGAGAQGSGGAKATEMNVRAATLCGCIILGLLAAPPATPAQHPAKVPRIGYLAGESPGTRSHLLDAFREGLSDLGWVEGQNIVIEYRWAEGKFDRLSDLAADLVRLQVLLIVAEGEPVIRAAKQATSTVPIVMAGVGDPVGAGFVASLARPGGTSQECPASVWN